MYLTDETSVGQFDFLNYTQESHSDTKNKIVTSPAFMCDASFHEVFDSVGKMVEGVLKML